MRIWDWSSDGCPSHLCVRDAGNGIGRARTGCDEHDTRLPGRTGIALCRMSGRLLMAHKHMLDRGVLKKGVVNGQHCAARISEHRVNAQINQRLDQYVRAAMRSEEHTSELQSLMRISYAVFC